MRGAVVVMLAVVACRPPPPEPLAREPELELVEPPPGVAAPVVLPRPHIDISALLPASRWIRRPTGPM